MIRITGFKTVSRRAASFIFVIASMFAPFVLGGCGAPAVREAALEADPCALFDSLFDSSGFENRIVIEGKATVDANDYHMRGKIRFDAASPGEVVFEFVSTILFGNQREDFLFSVHADTVRIIDRERGAYYEGWEAEDFLAQSMETDFSVPTMLFLAMGGHPPCDELSELKIENGSRGEIVCTGKHLGEDFRVVFSGPGPRFKTVEWPVRSERHRDDRLKVDYRWREDEGGAVVLEEIIFWLDMREWRCKIRA